MTDSKPTEAIIEALQAAKELAAVAEHMTSCGADDDFVWGVQAKIEAALSAALAHPGQVREIAIKPLEWHDAKDRGYSQADCALGQYQASWLGEFECWQCYRPHRSGLDWKDNFSRHASKDEAKAAAQSDYEQRIRSALALPLPVREETRYAERLATSLWEKHWKEDAPDWKPLSGDLIGILTQIDNMTAGLSRLLPETASVREGWRSIETAPKDGTRFIAAEHDGEGWMIGPCQWCKTSHIPLYGFHFTEGDPEDMNIASPSYWMPLPPSPSIPEEKGGTAESVVGIQLTLTRALGMYGSAYDPPGPHRAYTYEHQPANGPAYRLGKAASIKPQGGDHIDYGLYLLKALQENGFGVFEIEPIAASPAVKEGE